MKFLFVCFLGLIAIFAIGAAGSNGSPATVPGATGDSEIYASITTNTDCSSLQSQFEWASSTHRHWKEESNLTKMKVASSYMVAADGRMRAIGCY